jgi:probable rRNA maturation factor
MTTSRSARRRGLTVDVTGARGRTRGAARGLSRWLRRYAPAGATGTVAVALVSDTRMRALNRAFRGVDAPTDVLSFPSGGAAGAAGAVWPDGPSRSNAPNARSVSHLGDVAIARGVAAGQARREGHPFDVELRILALHGLLHLLGYDHTRDQGAMRRFEERLRRRAGLPPGLIARTPRRPTHR